MSVGLPAYRAGGREVPREQFYALACDPQRSVVVEACAGAGKTWMLVSRILRALLEGTQPQEILAITFTRKAAAELRERLAQWLAEFAGHAADDAQRLQALRERGVPPARCAALLPRLAGLQRQLLEGGRAVEIRTFHAWFAQLLQAAPLEVLEELALPREAELIETLDDHRAELLRRFHAVLLEAPDLHADYRALVARRGRTQASRWLDTVLARRVEIELADAVGTLEGSVAPAVPPGAPCPQADLLGPEWVMRLVALAGPLRRGGKRGMNAAQALEAALALAAPEARFDAVQAALFTGEGGPRKLGEVDGLAVVQDDFQRLARIVHQHESHLEHRQMVSLARVLLREYAAYKRGRGLIDMNDLERAALALLRDATLAGWVQERLDVRIRQVLIDEFQDTSPLQWQALHAWLAGYAGAGGGPTAPALFVVGDPKQSIYRFRRAEPRVFAAVRDFIVQGLGGEVLECDHTRRNAPGVLSAVNAVFEAASARGAFDGFRPHSTEHTEGPVPALWALPRVLRASLERQGDVPDARRWRDSLTEARHEPEEQLREAEAEAVASAIGQLLAEGKYQPGEVLVLSRKRESLRLAARALQARAIRYAAVEDSALRDSPEALDLLAVLDVLASPRHRLSLARALRSPLFGASDDELVTLATAAAERWGGDWWAALQHGALPGSALARAAQWLPRWRELARRLPPHDLLDRIVAEGEVRERVAATVGPARRAAALDDIDALLAESLRLDGGRYATPYGFVRALKRRALTLTRPAHPEAVQLLTVHGAKGLEGEAVFVMDADPEPRPAETTTLLVDWPVEAAAPRRCAFLYAESRCPPELEAPLAMEQAARRREELNGLYVAMTRARQALWFSATEPYQRSDADGPSWWAQVEPLTQSWLAGAPAGDLSSAVDDNTPILLPVLPTLPDGPAAPVGPAPSPMDSDAARLGRAVHRALEWAAADAGAADLAGLAHAAAAEFGAAADVVERIAGGILASPACARFFDRDRLRWAGNEVPVSQDGAALRIDRLVLLDEPEGPVWWVLDYKLQHRPQELTAYQDQLAAYRAAVRAAQPGATVRSAFIAGDGSLVEAG
ncbi:MAG: UvrD-helicase domain-containing protein [Piscinibacter sp.]|nr:UvrD-helicase domain-containing protein [Piscinibacter sp.]